MLDHPKSSEFENMHAAPAQNAVSSYQVLLSLMVTAFDPFGFWREHFIAGRHTRICTCGENVV